MENKITIMNMLKGEIKIQTKLLICLYPMSSALSMHQLHSFLLYTHYVLCTQISISEMNKIRHNHHFTKLNIVRGVGTGFYDIMDMAFFAAIITAQALFLKLCKLSMVMEMAIIK